MKLHLGAVFALLVSTFGAAAQSAAAGGVPVGAIMHFNRTTCPDGWKPLMPADGRFIVPLMRGGQNGAQIATALAKAVVPEHEHGLSTTVDVVATEFIAATWDWNSQLGRSGKRTLSGTSSKVALNLPFVALLACSRTSEQARDFPVRRGMLIFYGGGQCPTGWSETLTTQGRHLVALPVNGVAGSSFGGAPLQPQEVRQHTHPFSGSIKLSGHHVAVGSGCCAHDYATARTYDFSGTSDGASGGLPYIQLLQCEANGAE